MVYRGKQTFNNNLQIKNPVKFVTFAGFFSYKN